MVLSVSGLHQSFRYGLWKQKKRAILQDIDLTVQTGEIYALLGPNGSGKTTSLECIMGIHTIDQGQISFFGGKKLDNSIRQKIGYAPDQVGYFDHLTGWENVMTFASYTGINQMTRKSAGKELFNELELTYAKDSLVGEYSQGMKQRIGLIISLIHNPDLLIRDEPMNGLDPLGRVIVKKLMKKLQSKGKTIIFSTHILADVEEIADRFAILYQGRKFHESYTKEVNVNLEEFFCKIVGNANTFGPIAIG